MISFACPVPRFHRPILLIINSPLFYHRGAPGAAGPTGDTGDKGDTGVRGPDGDDGERGEKGQQGAKGSKGEKGTGVGQKVFLYLIFYHCTIS